MEDWQEHPHAIKAECKTEGGKPYRKLTWLNWSEFLTDVQGPQHPSTGPYRRASRAGDRGESWDLNAGWDGAIKLAQGGWPEGREKAQAIRDALCLNIADKMPVIEYTYDVTGECGIDMGRYMEGEPECFCTTVETDAVRECVSNKIVRVVLNTAASGGVGAATLQARGAALTALVDLLEAGGKRCEVWFTVALRHGIESKTHQEMWVRVKSASDVLQLDQVVFALSHPSCFRRLYFSAVETCKPGYRIGCCGEGNGGYGWVTDLLDPREEGEIRVEGAMYGDVQWTSEAAATEWVINKLREQGIEISDAHVSK